MTQTARALDLACASTPTEVLRTVVHELRQPLSSIESIAYYLTLVLPRADEKVRAQLGRIRELVEHSNWILSSGLQLAGSVPGAEPSEPEEVDLEEIITQSVAAAGAAGHASPRLELAGGLRLVRLDPASARTLVEGMLVLSGVLSVSADSAALRTSTCPDGALLELEIRSTSEIALLGPGTALGIENLRRIAGSHGGRFESVCDPSAGLRFRVMLP